MENKETKQNNDKPEKGKAPKTELVNSKYSDLTGRRFGRLVAVYPNWDDDYGHRYWDCICDCGNTKHVRHDHLISGAIQSCGCLHREIASKVNYKHGAYYKNNRERLYVIWAHIKSRCYDPNDSRYQSYGQRGIAVCRIWRNSYPAFKKWALANGYKNNLTIDRINPNGNYEPNNCQWLTRSENSRKGNHERNKTKQQSRI